MTLTTVPCAVCGGARFDPMYPSTIEADGDDPTLYFSSSRIRAGHLPIVRCQRCGLVMSNPRDDVATVRMIYEGLVDSVYLSEERNRRRAALEHLRLVRNHRPPPGRLLDIGCATGAFVSTAHEAGWQANGLDASEWAVARARERCPVATFNVGLVEDASYPCGAFDVVTLWDVLEHTASPVDTLRRVHHWTAPDGWLFLSLPNVKSLTARIMRRRWVLLLREHLWYFSPDTLAMLLPQAGFKLVRVQSKSVWFSVAGILGRLAQHRGLLGSAAAGLSRVPALKRLSVRFAMGEMHVAARAIA